MNLLDGEEPPPDGSESHPEGSTRCVCKRTLTDPKPHHLAPGLTIRLPLSCRAPTAGEAPTQRS